MNPIASQQQLLSVALQADGWQITDRASNLLHWAYYEIWTIESLWSPVGLKVFISFLTDAHPPSPSEKRRSPVWAVECTSNSPLERGATKERIALVGITHWDKGVPELIETLTRFRNNQA